MGKWRHVKPYSREFREQVVQSVAVGDRSQTEIAEKFGVSRESVRRWVRQAQLDAGQRTDGLTTSERQELASLRKEHRELLEECEILRKISAWFAPDPETGSMAPRRRRS